MKTKGKRKIMDQNRSHAFYWNKSPKNLQHPHTKFLLQTQKITRPLAIRQITSTPTPKHQLPIFYHAHSTKFMKSPDKDNSKVDKGTTQGSVNHLYSNDIRIKIRNKLGEFGPVVLDSNKKTVGIPCQEL